MDNIKICIVEDKHEIRMGLKMIINNNPELKCDSDFPNAEEAISFLSTQCKDVVLMDIDLPGMSGIEAIKILKTICPKTQFMMLTVFENDEMIFKSLQAGATGYLLKNSSIAQISQAIIDLYNGGSPMSPGIARKVLNTFVETPKKSEPDYQDLSEREREIANKLSEGFRYKEIADQLFVSISTVRTHIQNIYQKLHVKSRTDAVNKIFH